MGSYRRVELQGAGPVLVERERRELSAGEARVAVHHCSVNYTDVARIDGSYGGTPIAGAAFGGVQDGVRIPGYEPAGVVLEITDEVDSAVLGERVLVHSHTSCGECAFCRGGVDNYCAQRQVLGAATPGNGGWSEEIVVPAAQLLALPPGVSLQAACTLEVSYATALFCLRRGWELTLADGPVAVRGVPGMLALAAAQYAHAFGRDVVGIARDPDSVRVRWVAQRFPWLRLVGEASLGEGLGTASGGPPALIVEPLGGEYVGHDVSLVARGGAIGVIGSHLSVAGEARWDELFNKGATIYGTTRAPLGMMGEVAQHFAAGFVAPLIDREFALEDFAEAVRYVRAPAGVGRTLLRMAAASPE